MGELLVPASTDGSLGMALSLIGLLAVAIAVLLQPTEGSDDDDFGSGGGMMQPVMARTR